MELHLKGVILVAASCALCFTVSTAPAQQPDGGFEGSGVPATPASSASGNFFPQYMGGGAYAGFSADYLLRHHFGVGFEVNWRASRTNYQGVQPFRPILYDFNGVYAPPLGKRAALELQGGIGVSSTRFYPPFLPCTCISCRHFASANDYRGQIV